MTNLGVVGQFFGEQFIMLPMSIRRIKTMLPSAISSLEFVFRLWFLGTFVFYYSMKFSGVFNKNER
jgi:hypothetical protein